MYIQIHTKCVILMFGYVTNIRSSLQGHRKSNDISYHWISKDDLRDDDSKFWWFEDFEADLRHNSPGISLNTNGIIRNLRGNLLWFARGIMTKFSLSKIWSMLDRFLSMSAFHRTNLNQYEDFHNKGFSRTPRSSS